MKKLSRKNKGITLLLALTMATAAMTGCGNKENKQAPATEIDFADIAGGDTQENNTPETAAIEESSMEQIPEEESREGMYRSEITNEWIDESLKNQRPIAVMVDNEKKALPHYGLTEADVVYEIMNSTANGRVTRFMAIVKDWGKITQFGSIRSTRPTNIMLAGEWNAVLCHDGGPEVHVNAYLKQKYNNNLSGGFTRVKNGKPTEFTEYICTGDLDKKFANSNYSTEYNEYYQGAHYTFANSEVDLGQRNDSFDCTEIQLPFPHNGSRLQYNESTGTYDYYEYGEAHKDPQHDNAQLTFKNLLIQNCSFTELDNNGYMIYNVIDNPNKSPMTCVAYYITNGKGIELTWYKADQSDRTVYIDKATGEEVEINTGKTYVALVPSDTWNDVQMK